jgi:hypothetical protein
MKKGPRGKIGADRLKLSNPASIELAKYGKLNL